MRICIVQIKPLKGAIQENIKNHLRVIEAAIELSADLIIFSELSITGYEPTLAKELIRDIDGPMFEPFQDLSDQNNIAIGIGLPTKTSKGLNISMLIFRPAQKRIIFSKELLHEDELPYFVCGTKPPFMTIKGQKIAIGICYETLQRVHFEQAIENGADLYIASVAKSEKGIQKAYAHFPTLAKEFKTPILMSNCVGFCDNFLSRGQSAVWDENGNLVSQLDKERQGILVFDLLLKTVDKRYFE